MRDLLANVPDRDEGLMRQAGFKKNVNRATTQVMMKTGTQRLQLDFETSEYADRFVGHVEKTNDRDYEVEERYGPLGSFPMTTN